MVPFLKSKDAKDHIRKQESTLFRNQLSRRSSFSISGPFCSVNVCAMMPCPEGSPARWHGRNSVNIRSTCTMLTPLQWYGLSLPLYRHGEIFVWWAFCLPLSTTLDHFPLLIIQSPSMCEVFHLHFSQAAVASIGWTLSYAQRAFQVIQCIQGSTDI